MTPQPPPWIRTPGATTAPPARSCAAVGIPAFDPPAARPVTTNRIACQGPIFGVLDPAGVIRKAVARAIEMLENTIGELVHARGAVCAGAPPDYPTLSDLTGRWLKFCLSVAINDIRTWTAGGFTNGSVAEVIRRLTRVRNLIASNEMRYVCTGGSSCGSCDPGDWAFVCSEPNCGTPQAIVHLCRCFWVPGPKYGGKPGERFDAATQAEFQAQTIIHEASHLTHCTSDSPSRTIGGAECLAQFVAATNNSPIHPCFFKFCSCPGAPGVPSAGEQARINAFCNQHGGCNPPALARQSKSRSAVMKELDNPPFSMDDARKFADAGTVIQAQLQRNFLATDERGYLDRRQKLRVAFRSIPDSFAEFLFGQLTDPNDPLAKLFRYKLHPATVNEMIGILLEKMKRAAPRT